jgi:hypothetical protein
VARLLRISTAWNNVEGKARKDRKENQLDLMRCGFRVFAFGPLPSAAPTKYGPERGVECVDHLWTTALAGDEVCALIDHRHGHCDAQRTAAGKIVSSCLLRTKRRWFRQQVGGISAE